MTHQQKETNTKFFNMIISMTKDGGTYYWPNEKETYTIKNGKMVGKKSAIRKIKEITLPSAHSMLIVK